LNLAVASIATGAGPGVSADVANRSQFQRNKCGHENLFRHPQTVTNNGSTFDKARIAIAIKRTAIHAGILVEIESH
jgi:hypothetical protein